MIYRLTKMQILDANKKIRAIYSSIFYRSLMIILLILAAWFYFNSVLSLAKSNTSSGSDARSENRAHSPAIMPPMTLWGEDSRRKIWIDEAVGPNSNTKNKIYIHSAKNEWESFQIASRANIDLGNIRIVATNFVDPKGNKILPPTIYRQHNVHIEATPNTRYGRTGLVPDALIPLIHPVTKQPTAGKGGDRFNLNKGERLSFWLDVFIPKNALAGTYTSTVSLVMDGHDDLLMPIELQVYDFSLPAKKKLTACFQLDPGSISRSHNLSQRKKVDAEGLSVAYEKMLHQHYIHNWSPITGWDYTLNGMKVSVENNQVVIDWSDYDALIEPYMNGRAFEDGVPAQCLFVPYWLPLNGGQYNQRITKDNYQDIDLVLFAQYIRQVEQHFQAKGWLSRSFFFYFDEPFLSPWKYTAFVKVSETLKNNAPKLRNMVTDGYQFDRSKPSVDNKIIEDYVDVWDPVTFQVSSEKLLNYYRARRASGKFDMWCQTLANASERRAVINLFPEYDMPFHRMWGVMSWTFGFQGIELWQTSYMSKNPHDRINPWEKAQSFAHRKKPLNGDGRIFYPGTFADIGGEDIPVSSIRMKAVREAIEDYEYLSLLETLGGMDEIDMQRLHTTQINKAKRFSQAMPMGVGPWHWWEGDADVFMRQRKMIAELIVKKLRQRDTPN